MTEPVTVMVRRLHDGEDVPLPRYESEGSSGMDIRAYLDDPVVLDPGGIRLIPTGIAVAMPPGIEAQIRPRSGLALHHGIGLVNAPGTIDSDYRGEINIIMINWGPEPFTVRRGDRIAQMVFSRVFKIRLRETGELDRTSRGDGGFGHTGIT